MSIRWRYGRYGTDSSSSRHQYDHISKIVAMLTESARRGFAKAGWVLGIISVVRPIRQIASSKDDLNEVKMVITNTSYARFGPSGNPKFIYPRQIWSSEKYTVCRVFFCKAFRDIEGTFLFHTMAYHQEREDRRRWLLNTVPKTSPWCKQKPIKKTGLNPVFIARIWWERWIEPGPSP